MPWPALGPMRKDPDDIDYTGGHPTVPGDLDRKPKIKRHGFESPGNGQPGIPRINTAPRHTHGAPGPTPSGPVQPGVTIDYGEDD